MTNPRQGSVLVVDDEEIMREILETLLAREGYDVRVAASGAEGLELARAVPFDAALVDIMMPGLDGIATLDELRRIDDDLAVVIITAYASVESAISAMKAGAFDYITKPFKNDEVLVVVRNAMERRRLVRENRNLRQNIQERYHKFANIIGRSPRMRQVFDLIIQAAPSRSTILIQGESGTGKELVARAIHANSSRSDRAFVTVNSGNLPPDLLESTLFGHVKGAFTGAVYPKKGLFDLADKGSVFFDEIGNVALDTQAKLLRVIQERDFMRLGGMETIKVDVRIIAATNVDLRQMMEQGRFREDLFYRLHVISIQLPPLRDRKDDIPLLVQHFLRKYGEENRKTTLELTPEALDLLTDYDWPGNVRELENVIERAVVLATGTRIGVDSIPEQVRKAPNFHAPAFVVPPEGISFKDVITDFEKRLIETTLEAAGGVQKRAAELLHIKPTTLNEMIKRYDIRPKPKRGANGTEPPAPTPPAPAADRPSSPAADNPLASAGAFDEKIDSPGLNAMPQWLLFVVVGVLGGIASGLFGIGGGTVIVPALIYWAEFSQHRATGTSLAVLLPPVGLAATFEYYRHGNVDSSAAVILAAAMFVGAWGGAFVANRMQGPHLRLGFGAFISCVGVYLMYGACRRLGWL